jgi:hypothetical protein
VAQLRDRYDDDDDDDDVIRITSPNKTIGSTDKSPVFTLCDWNRYSTHNIISENYEIVEA